MKDIILTLRLATEADLPYLKEKMVEVFSISIIEQFGDTGSDLTPHTDELEKAFRLGKTNLPTDYKVYCILKGNSLVGGAVLKINIETWHNKLELFFICKEYLNQGLGLVAWKTIEREYPKTVIWELITPYLERRNINFYVNKCGFRIVEYFNQHHPDPLKPFPLDKQEDNNGYFLFAKEMK